MSTTLALMAQRRFSLLPGYAAAALLSAGLAGCGRSEKVHAETGRPLAVRVGVTRVARKTLTRTLTVSSELVPFQEVDVYAKVAGYVRDLRVDYGSRVTKGQIMAVLEIPELQVQLQQDDAAIRHATDQVTRTRHELGRVEAQHHVAHLQYERLKGVAEAKPGLVAQQEVDDAQGKDLANEAQVEATKSALAAAESQLQTVQAKKEQDRVLYDYSRITAPFTGIVTQRFANLGTLLQAGTNSSTQAMPLVRVSQDDLFRLVIPVPESDVRYIHVGEPVNVQVTSLGRSFPGKVARLSSDVQEDTRTMHTEVDIPNPNHSLIAGLYAEATLTLEQRPDVCSVPLEAVNHLRDGRTTVYIVDSAHKIQERPIHLGLQTATDVEIVSGLREGEMVVVSDRSGLKSGEEVSPTTVDVLRYEQQKEE